MQTPPSSDPNTPNATPPGTPEQTPAAPHNPIVTPEGHLMTPIETTPITPGSHSSLGSGSSSGILQPQAYYGTGGPLPRAFPQIGNDRSPDNTGSSATIPHQISIDHLRANSLLPNPQETSGLTTHDDAGGTVSPPSSRTSTPDWSEQMREQAEELTEFATLEQSLISDSDRSEIQPTPAQERLQEADIRRSIAFYNFSKVAQDQLKETIGSHIINTSSAVSTSTTANINTETSPPPWHEDIIQIGRQAIAATLLTEIRAIAQNPHFLLAFEHVSPALRLTRELQQHLENTFRGAIHEGAPLIDALAESLQKLHNYINQTPEPIEFSDDSDEEATSPPSTSTNNSSDNQEQISEEDSNPELQQRYGQEDTVNQADGHSLSTPTIHTGHITPFTELHAATLSEDQEPKESFLDWFHSCEVLLRDNIVDPPKQTQYLETIAAYRDNIITNLPEHPDREFSFFTPLWETLGSLWVSYGAMFAHSYQLANTLPEIPIDNIIEQIVITQREQALKNYYLFREAKEMIRMSTEELAQKLRETPQATAIPSPMIPVESHTPLLEDAHLHSNPRATPIPSLETAQRIAITLPGDLEWTETATLGNLIISQLPEEEQEQPLG